MRLQGVVDAVREHDAGVSERGLRAVLAGNDPVLGERGADVRAERSVGKRGGLRAAPDVHDERGRRGSVHLRGFGLHAERYPLRTGGDARDVCHRCQQLSVCQQQHDVRGAAGVRGRSPDRQLLAHVFE